MAYKARFQPLERLTPVGWRSMSADPTTAAQVQEVAIASDIAL
jgi:arginyl-tRNA--protein-N-Asp/Glu arginylyltransferase